MIMRSKDAFEAMRRVVERPGARLKAFFEDFFVHDRKYLEATWTEEARYLWMVRECGTHLHLLGVHPKLNDSARAVMRVYPETAIDFYLLSPRGGLRKIRPDAAAAALNRMDYAVRKGTVFHGERKIAALDLQIWWDRGLAKSEARFTSLDGPLPPGEIVALREIALYETVAETHTLFCRVARITLDGRLLSTPEEEERKLDAPEEVC